MVSATSRYDLHCHSTYSDGVLTPAAVVARAVGRGVDVLALTDHDQVAGNAEARAAAADAGIQFACGVEISASFESLTVHVVGLGVDPDDATLSQGLAGVRAGRHGRAQRIGDSLAEAGIPDAYLGARRLAGSDALVARTHFARYLVEIGRAKDTRAVFRRYLTPGKPGYVRHAWATLADAIAWIHGAGGDAVLAHPGRYPCSPTALRRLLGQFRDLGGDALEVISPAHTPAQFTEFATHARVYGLRGSVGSDFHAPDESWMDLGAMPPLPDGVTPVWADW
ncbi:MAG: PHP domain-containing protein [Proteobacteria bacterium]|nr:PHP domain-containing protein [Pseudomonadota bacterium]